MGTKLGWAIIDQKGKLIFMPTGQPLFFNRSNIRYWKAKGEQVVRARITWATPPAKGD